jgi:hypothetical protein
VGHFVYVLLSGIVSTGARSQRKKIINRRYFLFKCEIATAGSAGGEIQDLKILVLGAPDNLVLER